jgi:hypothetical protein
METCPSKWDIIIFKIVATKRAKYVINNWSTMRLWDNILFFYQLATFFNQNYLDSSFKILPLPVNEIFAILDSFSV